MAEITNMKRITSILELQTAYEKGEVPFNDLYSCKVGNKDGIILVGTNGFSVTSESKPGWDHITYYEYLPVDDENPEGEKNWYISDTYKGQVKR